MAPRLTGLAAMPTLSDEIARRVMSDYRTYDECMVAMTTRKANIAASVLMTAVQVEARKYAQQTNNDVGLHVLVRAFTELYERLSRVIASQHT